MMPEASLSGRLTLYRATSFPTAWEEHSVALRRPLVDASLVEWQGRWYLLGSDHTRRGATLHGARRHLDAGRRRAGQGSGSVGLRLCRCSTPPANL